MQVEQADIISKPLVLLPKPIIELHSKLITCNTVKWCEENSLVCFFVDNTGYLVNPFQPSEVNVFSIYEKIDSGDVMPQQKSRKLSHKSIFSRTTERSIRALEWLPSNRNSFIMMISNDAEFKIYKKSDGDWENAYIVQQDVNTQLFAYQDQLSTGVIPQLVEDDVEMVEEDEEPIPSTTTVEKPLVKIKSELFLLVFEQFVERTKSLEKPKQEGKWRRFTDEETRIFDNCVTDALNTFKDQLEPFKKELGTSSEINRDLLTKLRVKLRKQKEKKEEPKPKPVAPVAPPPKEKKGHACHRCRDKKAKCDGNIPCAKCVKDGVECDSESFAAEDVSAQVVRRDQTVKPAVAKRKAQLAESGPDPYKKSQVLYSGKLSDSLFIKRLEQATHTCFAWESHHGQVILAVGNQNGGVTLMSTDADMSTMNMIGYMETHTGHFIKYIDLIRIQEQLLVVVGASNGCVKFYTIDDDKFSCIDGLTMQHMDMITNISHTRYQDTIYVVIASALELYMIKIQHMQQVWITSHHVHSNTITGVALYPHQDKVQVYSVSLDGSMIRWNVTHVGTQTHDIIIPHNTNNMLFGCALSPNHTHIVILRGIPPDMEALKIENDDKPKVRLYALPLSTIYASNTADTNYLRGLLDNISKYNNMEDLAQVFTKLATPEHALKAISDALESGSLYPTAAYYLLRQLAHIDDAKHLLIHVEKQVMIEYAKNRNTQNTATPLMLGLLSQETIQTDEKCIYCDQPSIPIDYDHVLTFTCTNGHSYDRDAVTWRAQEQPGALKCKGCGAKSCMVQEYDNCAFCNHQFTKI